MSVCSIYKVSGDDSFHWYYSAPCFASFAILMGVYFSRQKNAFKCIILFPVLLLHLFVTPSLDYKRPLRRIVGTYQVKDKIESINLEELTGKNRDKLSIGLFKDSGECFLPGELAMLLRIEGYRNLVGGGGYPDLDMFLAKYLSGKN